MAGRHLFEISFWKDIQAVAYEVAWAYMRGELPEDEDVYSIYFRCKRFRGLKGMVDAIRTSVAPADEPPPLSALTTDAEAVAAICLAFRKYFLHDPTRAKTAWNEFTRPYGRVYTGMESPAGLYFKPAGTPAAERLQDLFSTAALSWNYAPIPSPEEVIEVDALSDEDLCVLVVVEGHHCPVCQEYYLALIPEDRTDARLMSMDAFAQEEAALCCDDKGRNWY